MSYSRVLDSRVDNTKAEDVHFIFKEGAQNVSYTPLTSSSNSTQTTSFSLNNIADRVSRDKRLCMSLTAQFTLTCTNTAGTPQTLFNPTSNNLGFKQYPLNRCVGTIQHQINQASYSLNTNQIIDSIARIQLATDNADFYNNTQPDNITNYGDAAGSNLNPILPYSSSIVGDGIYKPRSNNIDVSGNSLTSAGTPQIVVITCTIYEPLISPFNNIGKKNQHGLYAITGENITINWVNDLFNNMLAANPNPLITINSVVPSFGQSSTLNCIYLTPYPSFFKELPQKSYSHYNNYTINTQTITQTLAPFTQLTAFSTQVATFTNVPSKILIYIKDSAGVPLISTPDRYLQINSISCTFDNGNPQLSTCSTDQLYDISVRNGLEMPRDCFAQRNLQPLAATGIYGCGSVLVLDPALDLGIREGITDNSAGRFVFQATINATNATADTFSNLVCYVIGINDAVLERSGSEYRNYLLSLPYDAFEKSRNMDVIHLDEYNDVKESNMFLSGGSFWSKIGNAFKSAGKWLWKNKSDIVKVAEKVAPMVGLGEGEGGAEMGGYMGRHGFQHRRLMDRPTDRQRDRRVDLFYN